MLIVAIGLDMLVGRRSAWRNTELRPNRKRRSHHLGVFSTYTAIAGFCSLTSALGDVDDHVEPTPTNSRNPQAVERVRSGQDDVANAAWWGFNSEDSTTAIQGAIDSGAQTVIIPYMGQDWIVRPIKLKSHQGIFFEPGVVVIAKKGEFRGKRNALFEAKNVTNVTLRGYGATLRMRKKEYTEPPYTKSEFRHTLSLHSSSNISVLGLTFQSSGGDGIYIGPIEDDRRTPCRNIQIRDCVCDDNYRQGISVVSGQNVLIENCILSNTRGTAPQAAIDLEPGSPDDLMHNIRVVRCKAKNNAGTGLMVNLSRSHARSHDIDIRFEECLVIESRQPGVRVLLHHQDGPKGLIEFRNCVFEKVDYAGALCIWNIVSPLKLRFIDCKWRDVARRRNETPIHLEMRMHNNPNATGGIEFVDCYVYDDKNRPAITANTIGTDKAKYPLKGRITTINPLVKLDKWPSNRRTELRIDYRTLQD